MIKKVIKKIFPPVFLKNAFLIYNNVKIRTVDKFLFPEQNINSDRFLVKEEKNPFLDANVPLHNYSSETLNKLNLWLEPTWKQDQYFLHHREVGFIEPRYGWGVSPSRKLIYPSLGFSRATYVRKPSFLDLYLRPRKIAHHTKIISLRDTGEQNYFHFYNDVLAKIFYAEEMGINLNEYTIIISKDLFKKEYFQFFYKNSRIKNYHFFIQGQDWVQFDEAIFCKPYTHTKKYLDAARGLVQNMVLKHGSKRIFLTRSQSSLRFIENMNEIIEVIETNGFEIIDSETMNVSQQIALFSRTEFLISIHGAGLTNIIFREGNPLKILEIIHPFNYVPFHYIMMAHTYGFQYQLLLGEKGRLNGVGGFRVSPLNFKQAIEDLLNKNN